MSNSPRQEQSSDPRVAGLVTVGWVTLAALALSIPLVAIAGEIAAVIPIGVILGSGIMAMRIWSSGERLVNQKETEKLKVRIQQLEDRLANLEMVDSLEAYFAQRHQEPKDDSDSSEAGAAMGPPCEETAG